MEQTFLPKELSSTQRIVRNVGGFLLGAFILSAVAFGVLNGSDSIKAGFFLLAVALLFLFLSTGLLFRWWHQGTVEDSVRHLGTFQLVALVLFSVGLFVAMYVEKPPTAAQKCLSQNGDMLAANFDDLPAPYTDGCVTKPPCFGITSSCLIWRENSGYSCGRYNATSRVCS